MRRTLLLITLLWPTATLMAQLRPLTRDQYVKNDFRGIIKSINTSTQWLSGHVLRWNSDTGAMVLDCKTGKVCKATELDRKPSPGKSWSIMLSEHDLYLNDNGTKVRLTRDADDEQNPTLSPDSQYVAFTRNQDLYAVRIADRKEFRLTQDGGGAILNGYASWVYMEEILGRASQYRAFWWSPDSRRIAFFRSDESAVPEFTMTDATGVHGEVSKLKYPKVGDPNPEVKVGIVSPEGGAVVWADFNEKDDQYFGLPYWKPDGSALLVQWMNRKQNELKIWDVRPADGSKSQFLTETQKTWINLDDEGGRIRFLKNGKGFIYQSDRSGYAHLYLHTMDGKEVMDLTAAPATNVTDLVEIDEKKGVLFFEARKENTARRDFYRVGLDGKNLQRLTFGDYNHANISLSPDASYFTTLYNNASTPNQLAVVSAKGKLVRVLLSARGEQFDSVQLARTEIIRVPSDDSLFSLPMKITWPLNREAGKRYPVLISIYGGPNAGTVMDNWSLSGAQQWYAREGLIQVAMDHRASGHFGKQGVNYMYHNLGYWEMKDYSTLVRWLIENAQADPRRIAITGFSYGGYLSCYALTYGADVFTHAMAGGSVTDWSLYDSHYTERYMGTPADNAAGYKSSSVLTHADKYKGRLQIVHGIIDENVHLQNSIQLISKLQDLKKDFEFMPYSGARHGWGGNKWTHYQNSKTRFIYNYLLEKPVASEMLK